MVTLRLVRILTLLLLGVAPGVASAVTLAFSPTPQTTFVGYERSVQIVISGMGGAGPSSLGGYDLVLSFDPAITDAFSFAPGSALGTTFGDIDFGIGFPSEGSFEIHATSLHSPAELDAMQPSDSFPIAVIGLHALAPGETALTLSSVQLKDAFGAPLPVDATLPGSLTVPEPAAVVLLSLALAAFTRRRDSP